MKKLSIEEIEQINELEKMQESTLEVMKRKAKRAKELGIKPTDYSHYQGSKQELTTIGDKIHNIRYGNKN